MPKSKHQSLLTLLVCVLPLLLLCSAQLVYAKAPYWQVIAVRSFLAVLIVVSSLRLFYVKVLSRENMPEKTKNRWFLALSVFLTLVLLEFGLTFYPKTNNTAINLSHRIWEYYYGHPQNNWGFRGDDVIPEKLAGRKIVVVLGDSFTYGNGIKDYRQRYTNLLESKLPEDYEVINMGKGGNDTLIETQNLTQVPFKTDVVIHQYFGNDIEFAGYIAGKEQYIARQLMPGLHELNKYSFLVNFVTGNLPLANDYNLYIQQFYSDPEIFASHLNDIRNLVMFAESRGSAYIAVIFPFMADLEYSRMYTDKLISFYESESIPYINVADLVKDMDVKDRIIHKLDTHAGLKVQEIVAGALYKKMKELGLAG